MTNEQLSLLLQSMLDDLEHTLDDVRERMPEDAERETSQEWRAKPEYANEEYAYLEAALNPDKREYYTVYGEFAALEPLAEWLAKWRERVAVLASTEDAMQERLD